MRRIRTILSSMGSRLEAVSHYQEIASSMLVEQQSLIHVLEILYGDQESIANELIRQ